MAKYRVTLADGRSIDVHAPSEDLAMAQANHHETSRIEQAILIDRAQAESDDQYYKLKLMLAQYGEPIVLQMMRALQGDDYILPDFTKPNEAVKAKAVERMPASQAIALVKLKE